MVIHFYLRSLKSKSINSRKSDLTLQYNSFNMAQMFNKTDKYIEFCPKIRG